MSVILKEKFPVAEALRSRRGVALCKPLKIGIVNLMPLKERTESDLLRILDRYPADIEVDFISMSSHKSKNTSQQRVDEYYIPSDVAMTRHYDGMIITGAPVELYEFSDVDYWNELTRFMDWCDVNVNSTVYICWGAFAGLFHKYGIDKRVLPEKLSGVYLHDVIVPDNDIVTGFDMSFNVPCSRNTGIACDDFSRYDDLNVLIENPGCGPHLISGNGGRQFYVMGHWEYAPDTLDMEYRRDLSKGMNPAIPVNYYIDNNPDKGYVADWLAHGTLFYFNWLTFFCR